MISRCRLFPARARVVLFVVVLFVLVCVPATGLHAQLQYSSGQEVVPDYAGWVANPDGSFDLVFGYMNRNYQEHLHVPIGPDNKFEPGDADRGQPTYFYPRRNRHVFRIRVPSDFGSQELVWTLTSNGQTRSAYGSLKPDYALDGPAIYLNNSGYTMVGRALQNEAPVVRIEGDPTRTATVGEPLPLTAVVADDGIPAVRPVPEGQVSARTALGLRVAWIVYRGAGNGVRFDPPQFKTYLDLTEEGADSPWTPGWTAPPLPADGRHTVRVTFEEPGPYVIRVLAHDGGFDTARDVPVTVRPVSAEDAGSP